MFQQGHFDNYGHMEERQAIEALAALAHESRLRVFRLLVRHAARGRSAGQIAAALDIPPATLSFHLKELARAGLIDSRRNGRSIHYSLNVPGGRALLAFLLQDCCGGRPELCQLRDHNATGHAACGVKPRRDKRRSP